MSRVEERASVSETQFPSPAYGKVLKMEAFTFLNVGNGIIIH
jgi:hypothetical protein